MLEIVLLVLGIYLASLAVALGLGLGYSIARLLQEQEAKEIAEKAFAGEKEIYNQRLAFLEKKVLKTRTAPKRKKPAAKKKRKLAVVKKPESAPRKRPVVERQTRPTAAAGPTPEMGLG